VATAAGDEHPARVVDPDLLDLGVVEIRLERTEAGDARDQLAHHTGRVRHGSDGAGEAALVVRPDDLLGDRADQVHVSLRIDSVTAYDGSHLGVELLDERSIHVRRRGRGDGHVRLRSSRDEYAE